MKKLNAFWFGEVTCSFVREYIPDVVQYFLTMNSFFIKRRYSECALRIMISRFY